MTQLLANIRGHFKFFDAVHASTLFPTSRDRGAGFGRHVAAGLTEAVTAHQLTLVRTLTQYFDCVQASTLLRSLRRRNYHLQTSTMSGSEQGLLCLICPIAGPRGWVLGRPCVVARAEAPHGGVQRHVTQRHVTHPVQLEHPQQIAVLVKKHDRASVLAVVLAQHRSDILRQL